MKFEKGIMTVHFVYFGNVVWSGFLRQQGRPVSNRPSTRRSAKGQYTDTVQAGPASTS